MTTMAVADVLANYRDGDERGWASEFAWLWEHHGGRLRALMTSVQNEGVKVPILLGNDGRVWDGHHRLYAAVQVGVESVPVELATP